MKKKLKPAPNMIHVLCAYRFLKNYERAVDRMAALTATQAYEVLARLNEVSDPKFRKLPVVEPMREEVTAIADALLKLSNR